MAETLAEVKRRFGREAVILNTRTLTEGGLLGIGARPCVEITAAPSMSDLPGAPRRGSLHPTSRWTGNAEGAATPMAPAVKSGAPQQSEELVSQVGALRALVHDLVRETRRSRAKDLPDGLYEAYLRLVGNAVAAEIAQQLVDHVRRTLSGEQMRDAKAVRAHLVQAVESMLPTAGPIRAARVGAPTIVALIGPTGVGKTTTVAKLAANFCLREHRKVGMITIDTYRIGAVEQLRTYAQIIDVPLAVVTAPNELADAVARLADKDIILIDTSGRGQRDVTKIKELKTYFDVVRPDEVHLVLSGTCGETVLLETIDRFRDVGVDRVIFTKLDEAIGFGVMLSCLRTADAQLSYITTGQDVPDDIRVGRGSALARLVLGEHAGFDEAGGGCAEAPAS